MSKLFSYVVAIDKGFAPNPTGGYCTLANCKCRREGSRWRNIVELAKKGDWIVGTGGANKKKSSGHGTLIYAMRVEENPTLNEYYKDKRFKKRKGNCRDRSHRTDTCALISRHFWYFGSSAIKIPNKYLPLEKKGRGFKNKFDEKFIQDFTQWLEHQKYAKGEYGKPCCNGDEACTGGCKQTRRKC